MKQSISRRSFLKAMAGTAAVGALAACGSSASSSTAASTASTAASTASSAAASAAAATPDHCTLKILFKGPKPDGWDRIYEEFLNRTADTLNTELDITFVEHADYKDKLNLEMTSGADYDLVFDASWVHLKELAADGYYADFGEYLNNDNYPGLKKAFSTTVMENNKWFGYQCYIPLFRTLGNGVPAVFYRKDWATEWGVGEIDSMDKLEEYWAAAKEHDILPASLRNSRGFFQLYLLGGNNYVGAPQVGIMPFTIGGFTYWCYIKDNKVVSVAIEGESDDKFADFPEGWNRDFAIDRYEKFSEWQSKGYCSADSMTVTDADTPFWSGEAASEIGTLDDVEKNLTNFATYSPEAELGAFVYIDAARNMEKGCYPTTYVGNNGMCIPASSKNIERVMKFYDWMMSDAANHDLLELGIEGTDWNDLGDQKYEDLSGYAANFPGYGFTWNPNYVHFASSIPDDLLAYRKWETEEDSYCRQAVCGFNFDASSVEMSTLTAQTKAIGDTVNTTKLHGILSDGTNTYSSMAEMLANAVELAYANGADQIKEELINQLNTYMAENPQS